MERTALAPTIFLSLLLLAVAGTQFVVVAKANPSIPPEIPVIVTVPEMQVDANISRLNGIIYANVDSTYQTKTVYKLGDIYNAPIIIAYDRIDAYYPIPLNATNISIMMDDKELDWTYRNRDFSHLFDIDMPELNWTISPVPQEFSVTTHYEYPIPTTGATYAHLGNYAFLFPLESRYGLDAISAQYPGYSWFGWNNFGNPVAHFNIAVEPILTYIQVYSIDNSGALTPLNLTLSRDNKIAFDLPLAAWSSGTAPAPFGIVLVLNKNQETSEPFPTTFVIASLASVAVIGVGLLVYFRASRKARNAQKLHGAPNLRALFPFFLSLPRTER